MPCERALLRVNLPSLYMLAAAFHTIGKLRLRQGDTSSQSEGEQGLCVSKPGFECSNCARQGLLGKGLLIALAIN